jgi:hypothetical protein
MDEYIHRWMISYGRMSFLHGWISFMIWIKKIQNYLYPSSFVVQILISQTWMSFNNDDNEIVIIGENMMMGPKWLYIYYFQEQW